MPSNPSPANLPPITSVGRHEIFLANQSVGSLSTSPYTSAPAHFSLSLCLPSPAAFLRCELNPILPLLHLSMHPRWNRMTRAWLIVRARALSAAADPSTCMYVGLLAWPASRHFRQVSTTGLNYKLLQAMYGYLYCTYMYFHVHITIVT